MREINQNFQYLIPEEICFAFNPQFIIINNPANLNLAHATFTIAVGSQSQSFPEIRDVIENHIKIVVHE